ncbi:FAD/NAD(P)-binding domain-containing protein [Phlebopus sp. FC_14]|nr:FAD/NAD(P)-binding domain-containing protein [Phlebopus sp. FC_14]
MSNAKFRVAVCGGGVGGLTLAVALSKYPNVDVEIYEATHCFTEIGAGVGIWPRAFKVLRKLGVDIERELLSKATDYEWSEEYVPAINYRKSDQHHGVPLFQLKTKGDLMRFHRADFHGILLAHISESCKTRTAKRLVSYTQPPNAPIILTFTDGTTATCDLLVGADGIKSAVRACMMRDIARSSSGKNASLALSCVEPVWSGVTAYRTLISAEKLRIRSPGHRALHESTMCLLVYPISSGKFINFAGFTLRTDLVKTAYEQCASERTPFVGKWVDEVSAKELIEPFENFEDDVRPLLQCVDKGTLWAVHTVKHLPTYYHGRVALLGDAAHAMMPFQGSGAGQSIEDAYLLATVIGHRSTTLEDLPRALSIYDKLRRPFSRDVALRSKLSGQLCSLQEDVPLSRLGEVITKNWEWAWLSELDGALEDATRMLNSMP